MSEPSILKGLTCPRCGGTISIPEGQEIVLCPYCDLRSVVSGENGVRRYQIPNRINRDQALAAYQKFLSSNWAIALNARSQARPSEAFLVHLPFWAAWGRCMGWVFGQEEVKSGDSKTYRPKEKKVAEEMSWNGAACEVGEFGVNRVSLASRPLEPFQADELHRTGMVFEPLGSAEEALEVARRDFESRVRQKANLDRVSQTFVRIIRPRLGLVYYPLWVVRYLYHNRSFQVVVDGFSGETLYGKAPGNVLYRAAALVAGMSVGALVGIDLSYLTLQFSSGDDDAGALPFILLAAGLAMMGGSYRIFRYGEHYEFQRHKTEDKPAVSGIDLSDVKQFLREVEKFT